MKIIDKARVQNSFKIDCEGKGAFAEEVFLKYFSNNPKNKGKKLHDVRYKREYQNIDTDFIIDNDNCDVLPDFETVLSDTNRFIKVEVKYNTPALKTGKIAYEINSHGRDGWAKKTKCDYIFNVFGEEKNGEYCVIKIGIIDFPKWKECIEKGIIKTEKYHITSENITNILTYLNEMEKKGILKNYLIDEFSSKKIKILLI